MTRCDADGKRVIDWQSVFINLIVTASGSVALGFMLLGGYIASIDANTEFRKSASPRIERLDAQYDSISEFKETMGRRLDRLEGKIDRLLIERK